jgi:ubiquitin-protein ligase E3 B
MAESTQKQCIDQSCNDNIPSSGLDIYHAISKIQSNYCQNEDLPKLHKLCSYILTSMESDHPKMWYVSVALDKDHSVNWMKQVKWLLLTISKTLTNLKPGMPKDDQLIQVFLSVVSLL